MTWHLGGGGMAPLPPPLNPPFYSAVLSCYTDFDFSLYVLFTEINAAAAAAVYALLSLERI